MATYNVWALYSKYSSYLTGAETLADAVAKARWARDYYEPMYPGTVRVEISVTCERCAGNGRIAKGRRNVRFPKYADCPVCKGETGFPIPAVA